MKEKGSFLETSWDNLLSRDPKRILKSFELLDVESQKTVVAHLRKMTTETGWHLEQIKSANEALEALKKAGILK